MKISFNTQVEELVFVGMARSGNHAIIHWALAHLQMGDDIAFLNNISLSGNALECASGYGVVPHHRSPLLASAISYSFEDIKLKDCLRNLQKFRPQSRVILILRDPFNLFASRLQYSRQNHAQKSLVQSHALELWLEHAECFIEAANNALDAPVVPVSYNSWFSSKWYRDWRGAQVGFVNTDQGIDIVPPHGLGSSFDQFQYNGKARNMQVLERWTFLVNDAEWRSFFRDDVIAKAELIFGCEFVRPIVQTINHHSYGT